jgi:hypothetical protein
MYAAHKLTPYQEKKKKKETEHNHLLKSLSHVRVCYLCISASSQPTVHELVKMATLDNSVGGGRFFK